MRACYIDVQNYVVKEYAMTGENVSDTFLNENICFKSSMIQNMKKERYLLLFTCVCVLADRSGFCTGLPCHHQYHFSSPPCLAWQPILTPQSFWGNYPYEWSAPCFNNDKQDEWQSSIPKMSLFPLRSFWEHFLREARSWGVLTNGNIWVKIMGYFRFMVAFKNRLGWVSPMEGILKSV